MNTAANSRFRAEVEGLIRETEPARVVSRIQALVTELGSALTLDEVASVVIHRGADDAEASMAGIWMHEPSERAARLLRLNGDGTSHERCALVPLDACSGLGAAITSRKGVFVGTRAELVERYPVTADHFPAAHAIACFPLVVLGDAAGVVAFAFDAARAFDPNERAFLQLLADQSAQAFHRAIAYDAQERARSEMALLYGLLDTVNRAATVADVYDAALEMLEHAMGVTRSSILLFDDDGVMRFKASRGISAEYRNAVEGHTPWSQDTRDPDPIFVLDVEADASLAAYTETFRKERIRGLGFLPLVHRGCPIGKFMVYSAEPRVYTADEVRLAQTIASQIAQAVVRKRAEAEVEAALTAAEQASRMKDEFLAVVSHELRAPLSAIVGWSAILQTDRRHDAATLAKGISVIDRNAKAQSTIIDDILDVSRIVRGKLVLDTHPIALVPIVVDTIESLKTSAAAKEIEVRLDVGDGRFDLVGDSGRLRQIVWNLLSNALKFTPARGRVSVRLRQQAAEIVLEVEDTGRGIAPEFLPFVFDRFRQVDSSTTRREGGLGLGLSIVRHLVELHGGQVAVRSRGLDKGATFSATFPVRAVVGLDSAVCDGQLAENAASSVLLDGSLDLRGVRVLVVDDQLDAREIQKEALVSYGATVEVAGSAHEAITVLPQFKPMVLVTDIGMPDEDGYLLLRRVRALPGPRGLVPAVAVTAFARAEDVQRARDAGFQSHVAKPAHPEVLARAVMQALVTQGPCGVGPTGVSR